MPHPESHRQSPLSILLITSIGVVFGDIGTSPLYALKETLAGTHTLSIDQAHVYGILSLIFWTLLLVVSVKYLILTMRIDNKGEGGSLALLALLNRALATRKGKPDSTMPIVTMLSLIAAALFYGDSIITPAISVLSAVEGLELVNPALSGNNTIVYLTITILLALFAIQRWGTTKVGGLFGPIMILWFATLAISGLVSILHNPDILRALSPLYACRFFLTEGFTGFLTLGAVVLAVTGAEALYADMGHFGRLSIQIAWSFLVWPALILNYFGQGALLLATPSAIQNPFFLLFPPSLTMPMVILATLAAIIASQAVISGAFSVTAQAIQLGYLPRMSIKHTSEKERGQIYIPFVNLLLTISVIALVMGFKSSSSLAAAYGIAVTGTMVITTMLLGVVMRHIWGWKFRWILLSMGILLSIDGSFFIANIAKIPHGGWFPLAVGLLILVLLNTWKRGRDYLRRATHEKGIIPIETIFESRDCPHRVRGTAIYLAGSPHGLPQTLLQNLKHNHVLHDHIALMTIRIDDTPYVPRDHSIETTRLGPDIYRIILHYGFMQTPNIPRTLANAPRNAMGFDYDPVNTSYFVSRVIATPGKQSDMMPWQEKLFTWMLKNSTGATEFFRLPPDRVVELGVIVSL